MIVFLNSHHRLTNLVTDQSFPVITWMMEKAAA